LPLPWFRRRAAGGEQQRESAPVSQPAVLTPDPAPAAAVPTETATDPDAPARPKRRRGSRGGRNRKKPAAAGAATSENGDAAPAAKTARTPAAKTGAAEPGAAEPGAADAAAAEKPKRKTAREKPERKESGRGESGRGESGRGDTERKESTRSRSRKEPAARRRAPRRAPLPKAKRELMVAVDAGEKRVAVLEDGRVAEVYLERPERRSIAGNIYKGVVDNVLPGMEAAFVEIGLEKNGFLYVDEIVGPELEGRKSARKIADLISKGEEILVQAVKDPMKTKGARLTTEISLPGRFVVYQPHGEGLGVSRRLDDDERNRLKGILKEIAPKKGGVIVRTAAEGASDEDVQRDLDFLERLWKTIEAQAKAAKPSTLVYQEAELPLRVTRDLFTGDFEKAYVDHDRTYKRIVGYLKKTSPHMVERVVRYKEKEPLMEAFGVDAEIRSTLNKRVDLPSGGYLIFDYAEAFTVVDVNTGRFVGSRSKTSGARLEDTITKNNLEAVTEVVRQLRLRDIGGIIVIDFIDMANPKNRHAVEEALRSELEKDRTKTYVVEISPLGLVEMTRQNVTDGPREVMTKKCPTCGGDGIVISEYTAAVDVERRLRALVAPGSRTQAYRVEVNARIASLLVGPGAVRLREIEELTRRVFFLAGKEDVHLDHFAVLEQGPLEKLRPEAPFEEGKTVSVKLGEIDRHDGAAGVGKLDGFSICVADAARLVGKTVKVRVEKVLDGVAYATLVTPVSKDAEPITAENEAEKPTRARRPAARKATGGEGEAEQGEAGRGDADAELDEQPLEADAEAEVDAEAEAEADETEADGESAAPKKRTRRGSRGGRRRKKKPVDGEEQPLSEDGEGEPAAAEPQEAAAAADDSAGAEQVAPVRRPSAPRIHIPGPEFGREDGEGGDDEPGGAGHKKPRRGTRGGRNRTRKPETASTNGVEAEGAGEPEPHESTATRGSSTTPEAETPPEAAPTSAEAEPAAEEPADESSDDGEWGYVPMSEWGDDFRSRS
jgi:ribonuclease G